MDALRPDPSEARAGYVRVNGLAVLAGIVLLGVGSGAGYYAYKQPRVAAEFQAELDAAPTTAEGRVRMWHEFGAPQIHHRITKVARLSAEHPWLVVHALDPGDGGPPEAWGLDLEALPRPLSRVEGLTIVVELPAPRRLGRAPLAGDKARFVPVYGPGDAIPDPREPLRARALAALERLPQALAKDIEGARLEMRIDGDPAAGAGGGLSSEPGAR